MSTSAPASTRARRRSRWASKGAGEVEAVGDGVEEFSAGDYVAFAGVPGAYAEYINAPVESLVPFNVTMVEARMAAAIMLQGMTAHYLTHSTFPIEEGQTVLLHAAAAGGVGLLLCQMAKMRGAGTVIGTVGTEEKAKLAKEAGADETTSTPNRTSSKRWTA